MHARRVEKNLQPHTRGNISCLVVGVGVLHLAMCRLFIGLAGLATDQQTFYEKLRFRMAMYSLREEREMKPASFGKLVSSLLYEKRFGPYFVEPVIAGLDRSLTQHNQHKKSLLISEKETVCIHLCVCSLTSSSVRVLKCPAPA